MWLRLRKRGFFYMENKLETQRLGELAAKQAEMSAAQQKALRRAEKGLDKMARPTVDDKPVDYDALTKKINAEIAESEANAEARDGTDIKIVFDDAEQMKYDLNYRRLADFIGIDAREISRYANELSVIMGWAVENAGQPGLIGAFHAIKDLKNHIGFQEVGPTSIKKLYRYIRLDLDSQSVSDRQTVKQINAEKELLKE